MGPNDGPPPGNPGDLGHTIDNQLATQASYPHDNDVNMEGEDAEDKTGLETVDFNTYKGTLTASTESSNSNVQLGEILRNSNLPEVHIQPILAASQTTTSTNYNIDKKATRKIEMTQNVGEIIDHVNDNNSNDDDRKTTIAKITPMKNLKNLQPQP